MEIHFFAINHRGIYARKGKENSCYEISCLEIKVTKLCGNISESQWSQGADFPP